MTRGHTILRLQHLGTAYRSHRSASARLARLGLAPSELRTDQGRGFQLDSRTLLGNECWLHVVHNWNPEARVCRYLRERGEGLEHIAIETRDIQAAVARVREMVPIFADRIFHAADGFEAFVFPDHACGFTVELIQPHDTSWNWPNPPPPRVSPMLAVRRLAEVVAGAPDPSEAADRFQRLFGLGRDELRSRHQPGRPVRIPFPNRCALRFVQGEPGLRGLVFGSADPEGDRRALTASGVPNGAGSRHGDVRIPKEVVGFEVVLRSDPIA